MARDPAARRVHREATSPDDAFIARMLELTAWAKQHATALIAGGIVVVVAGLAGAYYLNYQGMVKGQAAARLAEVRQVMATGQPAEVIGELDAFVTRFDGTRAADEGRVLLAQVYLEQGQAEKAATVARPLVDDLGEPLAASGAVLLAAAHEASGAPDQAEALYLRIAEQASLPFQRRAALDDAARIRMQRGDATGAVELYRRILETLPDDAPDRRVYQMRLGEAQAASLGTPTS